MTIRGDSYSSTAEVKAMTRHLLDGQTAFNSTTIPTGTEFEKFIDRASGVLNVALSKAGFSPSALAANSTAKLACDDWVTFRAAEYVELTQRGTGYSSEEGSRIAGLSSLYQAADAFTSIFGLGWKRLGVSVTDAASQGLTYTALLPHSQRSDPDNAALEQPKFRRGQFGNPNVSRDSTGNEDD